VLKNIYCNKTETFDKLFGKLVSKYYTHLIKEVEKVLFSE